MLRDGKEALDSKCPEFKKLLTGDLQMRLIEINLNHRRVIEDLLSQTTYELEM